MAGSVDGLCNSHFIQELISSDPEALLSLTACRSSGCCAALDPVCCRAAAVLCPPAPLHSIVSGTRLGTWNPATQLSPNSQAGADSPGDAAGELKHTLFWDLHFAFVKEMSHTHKSHVLPMVQLQHSLLKTGKLHQESHAVLHTSAHSIFGTPQGTMSIRHFISFSFFFLCLVKSFQKIPIFWSNWKSPCPHLAILVNSFCFLNSDRLLDRKVSPQSQLGSSSITSWFCWKSGFSLRGPSRILPPPFSSENWEAGPEGNRPQNLQITANQSSSCRQMSTQKARQSHNIHCHQEFLKHQAVSPARAFQLEIQAWNS